MVSITIIDTLKSTVHSFAVCTKIYISFSKVSQKLNYCFSQITGPTTGPESADVIVTGGRTAPEVIELLDSGSEDNEVKEYLDQKLRREKERDRKHKLLTKRLHRRRSSPCEYAQYLKYSVYTLMLIAVLP